MLICTYEDRAANLVGIKLLALSLRRHSPTAQLQITCPVADDAFGDWCDRQSNVTLLDGSALRHDGWDVKPALLSNALDAGEKEAFWVDADILVTGDIRPLLTGLAENVLAGAEDHPWARHAGGTVRTEGWSMAVGRSLPNTFNTCVMRVTAMHRPLLAAWSELTAHPDYRAARQRPITTRPAHLRGGQDLLTALLGSERFADVPIHWVRCGPDIVHCAAAAGHTVGQRLRHAVTGLPPLVHAMARKPWALDRTPLYERLYLETSAYVAVAHGYRDELDEAELAWTAPQTRIGRLMTASCLGSASLRGLPLAMGESIVRAHRRRQERAGRTTAPNAPVRHIDRASNGMRRAA